MAFQCFTLEVSNLFTKATTFTFVFILLLVIVMTAKIKSYYSVRKVQGIDLGFLRTENSYFGLL